MKKIKEIGEKLAAENVHPETIKKVLKTAFPKKKYLTELNDYFNSLDYEQIVKDYHQFWSAHTVIGG
jgi:arginine deiminase